MTPQLTAMIPISRRTIARASAAGLGGEGFEVDVARSRSAAPVRAPSARKETKEGQDPVR